MKCVFLQSKRHYMSQGLFSITISFLKANIFSQEDRMEKAILGGIAIGALTLLTKKYLDSKAQEECMNTGEYILTQFQVMFESIESKAQTLTKKVDDCIENTDFSTLDKIDSMLGGKIEKTLQNVGNLVDVGSNAFDNFIYKSSLFSPVDKVGYAPNVLATTFENTPNDKEAVERAWKLFSDCCKELKSYNAENPQYLENEAQESSIEKLSQALNQCEKSIDQILSAVAKDKQYKGIK